MNSWEKFLPAITARPGCGWQGLNLYFHQLELFLSICTMMNPFLVPRTGKYSWLAPATTGCWVDQGGVWWGPHFSCSAVNSLHPIRHRGRAHYPGQVETVIIICLGIFFLKAISSLCLSDRAGEIFK